MKRLLLLGFIITIALTFTCCGRSGTVVVPGRENIPRTVDASVFFDGTQKDGAAIRKSNEDGITTLIFTRTDANGCEVFSAQYRGRGNTLTAVSYTLSDYNGENLLSEQTSYGLSDGSLIPFSHIAREYSGEQMTETCYDADSAVTGTSVTQSENGIVRSKNSYSRQGLLMSEATYGEKQTENTYSYEFGNLTGRVTRVTEGNKATVTRFSADNRLLSTSVYTYGEDGRLLTESFTSPESPEEDFTENFSYTGILCSSVRKNPAGETVLTAEDTSEDGVNIVREFSRYEHGNLSEKIKEMPDCSGRTVKSYRFNANGTLVEYILYGYSCSRLDTEHSYIYTDGALSLLNEKQYDAEGDLVSLTEYTGGDVISRRDVYAVTDKGHETTRYTYKDGRISSYSVTLTDRLQRELSLTVFDPSGNPVSKSIHSYHTNGAILIEGSFTYTAGAVSGGRETEHNDDGTVASETEFGTDGKTRLKHSYTYTDGIKTGMSATGVENEFLYRETYEYGENGLVSLMHRYLGNNELIMITGYDYEQGIIINESTYEYKANGALDTHTETTYASGKINTVNRFNAAEVLLFSAAYTYTADGKVLVKEYTYTDGVMTKDVDRVFDSAGNPLEYTERTGWGEVRVSETYTVPETESVITTEAQSVNTEETQSESVAGFSLPEETEVTAQLPTQAATVLSSEISTAA